jgi:hypothetical protein
MRTAAGIALAMIALGGCGSSVPYGQDATVRAWADAQNDGDLGRACDLTAAATVRALGGRKACLAYYAGYPFGRELRVQPNGLRDPVSGRRRHTNVYPLESSNANGGVLGYGGSVVVVRECGVFRVLLPVVQGTRQEFDYPTVSRDCRS